MALSKKQKRNLAIAGGVGALLLFGKRIGEGIGNVVGGATGGEEELEGGGFFGGGGGSTLPLEFLGDSPSVNGVRQAASTGGPFEPQEITLELGSEAEIGSGQLAKEGFITGLGFAAAAGATGLIAKPFLTRKGGKPFQKLRSRGTKGAGEPKVNTADIETSGRNRKTGVRTNQADINIKTAANLRQSPSKQPTIETLRASQRVSTLSKPVSAGGAETKTFSTKKVSDTLNIGRKGQINVQAGQKLGSPFKKIAGPTKVGTKIFAGGVVIDTAFRALATRDVTGSLKAEGAGILGIPENIADTFRAEQEAAATLNKDHPIAHGITRTGALVGTGILDAIDRAAGFAAVAGANIGAGLAGREQVAFDQDTIENVRFSTALGLEKETPEGGNVKGAGFFSFISDFFSLQDEAIADQQKTNTPAEAVIQPDNVDLLREENRVNVETTKKEQLSVAELQIIRREQQKNLPSVAERKQMRDDRTRFAGKRPSQEFIQRSDRAMRSRQAQAIMRRGGVGETERSRQIRESQRAKFDASRSRSVRKEASRLGINTRGLTTAQQRREILRKLSRQRRRN